MQNKPTLELSFPFEILNAFVSGYTAIDIPRLILNDLSETVPFLECYGYRWDHPGDRKEIETIRKKAIEFIEVELLLELELATPEEVASEKDVRFLLLWASDLNHEYQPWACAILRVAHTLAHCYSHFNERYGDHIRQQIFSRFEEHLHRENDRLYLGFDEPIELLDFEAKPQKALFSVVLKLLHKSENVATDIFDRIGLRFITKNRFDAVLVVRYLRLHNIVMFANVKPSRSRNTLVDIPLLQKDLDELQHLSREEALVIVRNQVDAREYPGPPEPSYNPYSDANYHSIQFTCRQLIRIEEPESARFFFPFEIQILDEQSYMMS
jgi:uncharacterized protein (TIGR04562 family)